MTADVTTDTAEYDQEKIATAPAGNAKDPVDGTSWRGIAAEHAEDVSAPLAALLRRRSRVLLANLLRPHRRSVTLTAVLIVISSLCALAGPWLIGIAIDSGLPPMLKGNAGPLLWIALAFAVTVVVQAFTSQAFVTMTGRIGQTVVLELRRRLFAHVLRLSVSFHESYTSGRVISRQTSDVEAISALFDEGLDSLIMAVLTLLLVGTGMLLLDWPLALVVLSGFIPLVWLSAWFRRESAVAYRRIRDANALVIVHFVETFGGLRAVQAFRREQRNEEIFDTLSGDYAAASKRSSQLSSVFAPGIAMVGNVIMGVVLCYGGFRVLDGDIKVGVLASVLRPAAGRVPVLQLLPGRRLRAGEALRRARGGTVRRRAGASGRTARRAVRAPGVVRLGAVRLPQGGRAAGLLARHTRRADGGARRRDRGGQDHGRAAARQVLRPQRGTGAARRC
jgi:ATP-binding cassette, subfamily B, bacterial